MNHVDYLNKHNHIIAEWNNCEKPGEMLRLLGITCKTGSDNHRIVVSIACEIAKMVSVYYEQFPVFMKLLTLTQEWANGHNHSYERMQEEVKIAKSFLDGIETAIEILDVNKSDFNDGLPIYHVISSFLSVIYAASMICADKDMIGCTAKLVAECACSAHYYGSNFESTIETKCVELIRREVRNINVWIDTKPTYMICSYCQD